MSFGLGFMSAQPVVEKRTCEHVTLIGIFGVVTTFFYIIAEERKTFRDYNSRRNVYENILRYWYSEANVSISLEYSGMMLRYFKGLMV